MATEGERLATLEAIVVEMRDDIRALRIIIDGGNGVEWQRSVRGRLHRIENDLAALLLIRRGASQLVGRGWKFVAGVALLLTAAAPYILWFFATH